MTAPRPPFHRTLVLAVLLVLVAGACALLGFAQLERAGEQRALRERLARGQVPPVRVTRLAELEVHLERPVRLRGRFLPPQVIIDQYPWRGRTGYLYVAAFRLAGRDENVLVARGWRPRSASRRPPEVPLPRGEVTLVARVTRPVRPYQGGLAAPGDAKGGRWAWLDPEYFSGKIHPVPVDLLLEQWTDTHDGLARDWPGPQVPVGKYLGRALQWFLFALVAAGAAVRLVWRLSPRARE